jgi:hypothetical protein
MNDLTTRHPGDAEYQAAISGMHEHTPSPRPEPAAGDFVSGETAGRRWSGRVERIENGSMTLDVGGAWLAVPVTDITH